MAGRQALRVVLYTCAVLIAAYFAVTGWVYYRSLTLLSEGVSRTVRFDTVFVFYGDDGAISDARLEKALSMYQQGVTSSISFVGGCRPQKKYFGAMMLSELAIDAGVNVEDIFVGPGSYDTRSNLASIEQMIIEHKWTHFAYISDPMHLVRIRNLIKFGVYSSFLSTGELVPSSYGRGCCILLSRSFHEAGVTILNLIFPESSMSVFLQKVRLERFHGVGADLCLCCKGA